MFFVKKSTYTELLSRMEEVSRTLTTTEGDLTLGRDKIASLEAELVRSHNEAAKIRASLGSCESELKNSLDKNKALEKLVNERNKDIRIMTEDLEETKKRESKLIHDLSRIKKEKLEAEKSVSGYIKDNADILARLADLKSQKELIENSIPGYEATITNLNKVSSEQASDLADAMKELGAARKEIEVLKGKKGGKR